ncbi:immunoglobulin-like domain-containing receptor 2 isoform X2 [Sphaerodactylus townsendi]|uniref:immunoglobulin-like domain-containing receptor 2 isoform X2 n=1 Tax=Sphaerodactylus townsendi TaxID=933632 RepID=UPI00202680F5|nr:immunoglobulin-like domain-containing receptor 2 isoform X2 [Sphaerodactylus townsendi]
MDGVLLGWTALLWVTVVIEGLQVMVPEKKRVAMLFQPVVLRCHFSTSSTQPAVVQWKFKSYCQDRMGEALGVVSAGIQAVSKRNLEWDPYVDCVDSRRTVRIVASKQGSAVTIGEFYKGRDVTIVHDADLHIGKLMWGDSGLYYCIIVTPDDVEGENEESVELLVLEWVFVGLVILGAFLFFLLVGICWCQCCPHSCCCYVRCPCCPDTCCCPRALYEAGKAAKAGYPPGVPSIPGPYYIPTVPVAGAPSHAVMMEKSHLPPLAPSESSAGGQSVRKGYRIQADKDRDSMKVLYYVEKELAQFDPARRMRERYNNTISELSSLHEQDANFRQSFRQVRRKPLPPPGGLLDGDAEYWTGVVSGGGMSRPQTCSDYREERGSFRLSQQRSKSEKLSRKSFSMGMPAVSMDELAAFAESYSQRARRTEGSQEPRRFERSGSRGARGGAVQHQDNSSDEYYGAQRGNHEPLADSDRGWSYSPPRRRTHDEKHLPRLVCRTPGGSQKYDHSYLTSALERKSRSYDESGEHSETPSKLSSHSSQRGGSYYAWSPPSTYKSGQHQQQQHQQQQQQHQQQQHQQQPPQQEEGEDSLPPYTERELSRGSSYRNREQSNLNSSEKKRKKEPKKTNEFPTRMSLVV